MKLGCLIAPTTADIRDVMVEGPSGLLAVAPPWCRPRFEPSKRRVVWPQGARVVCLSGEEPERARGLNVDTLWADELACWQRAESTWDLAMLALRAGTDPRALITTTPRRVAVLSRILAEATTVKTTDSTYANQAHLPRQFLEQIVGLFENTRLGRQEIHAEFLDTSEGAGSTDSTRRGMSRRRPNMTPLTTFAARSMLGRRGIRRRYSFRSATIMAPHRLRLRCLAITTPSTW